MKSKHLLGAMAAIALAPLAAQAETPAYYLGLSGGANFERDSDFSGAAGGTADFSVGPTVSGYFGHRYPGTGFRTELELGYRTNDVDTVSGANGTGDTSAIHGLINLIYDFNRDGTLKPYVGVGFGAARVEFDGVGPLAGLVADGDEILFAYQGIAGLSYGFSETIELFTDYKYFATGDVDLNLTNGAALDAEYDNHVVSIGFRWSFGGKKPPMVMAEPVKETPPPPPPPEPEPAPPPPPPEPEPEVFAPQAFLVFFDHDRSVLTDEAQGIVNAAANYSREASLTRLQVTGHADRSGSARYNEGLSLRRAQAVRAELVRLGVPEGAIAIFARGETEPLVPTRDGVREPQNRRVEIMVE